ncbi:MAG: O-antigen ligase family protein [Negativicutes bacterium]|jgi:O-antigen ligase
MSRLVGLIPVTIIAVAIATNSLRIFAALPIFALGGFLLLFLKRDLAKNERLAIAVSIFYFLVQLMSNYFTPAPEQSLMYTLRIVGLPVGVFIIVLLATGNRRAYWLLVATLLISVAVIDANIVFNALNGIGRTGKIPVLELAGMFQWPDWFNSIACPFAVIMFIRTASKSRWLWLVAGSLFFTASLLNGSRMLWISLFLCCLTYLAITAKLTRRNILCSFAALLLCGLVLYFIPTTRWRILIFFDPNAIANVDRIAVWTNSLYMIGDFPWFGVGNGMFKFVFNKYYTFGHVFRSGELSHAHNLLLARLADSGIVGTIPFVAMLWYYFKSVYVKMSDNVQPEIVAGFMAMCGWLFMGIFDYCLRFPPISLAFAIIAALTIARANMSNRVIK